MDDLTSGSGLTESDVQEIADGITGSGRKRAGEKSAQRRLTRRVIDANVVISSLIADSHRSATMGLVAEFDIDCEHLPLVSVAAAVPEATLVLELQFNHDELPLFVLSVTDGDRDVVEEALEAAPAVGTYTVLGEAGDTRRYQAHPGRSLEAHLGPHLDDLSGLRALASTEAIIQRIEVLPTGWRQSGWFAHRDAFDEFRQFWQRNSSFRLRRLTRQNEAEPPGEGLTDRQQEALRIAYERGYFDIPREASLEDVAEELDVTASSVSERLRRAQTRLIEETMAPTWPSLPD
jgi:predicted DNA binding protein